MILMPAHVILVNSEHHELVLELILLAPWRQAQATYQINIVLCCSTLAQYNIHATAMWYDMWYDMWNHGWVGSGDHH